MTTSNEIVPYQYKGNIQEMPQTPIVSKGIVTVGGCNTWRTISEKIAFKLACNICKYVLPVSAVSEEGLRTLTKGFFYGVLGLTVQSIQKSDSSILLNPYVGICLAVIIVANAVLIYSIPLSVSFLNLYIEHGKAEEAEIEKTGRYRTIDYTNQDLSVSQIKDLLNNNQNLDAVQTLKIKVRSDDEIRDLTEYKMNNVHVLGIDFNFQYVGAPHAIDIQIPETVSLMGGFEKKLELPVTFIDLKSAFQTLGLSPDCTKKEFETAYRKMALKCHPDKANDIDIAKEAQMRSVNEAKEFINKYHRFGKSSLFNRIYGLFFAKV